MKGVMRGIVWLAVLSAGWFGQACGWWDPDVRLIRSDSIAYFSQASTGWGIAADYQDGVHLVWYDTRDGWASEAYYKRSTNGGITWGADVPLTSGSQYWQEMSSVACDSRGRVHVVYTEYYYPGALFYPFMHYKRSTDRGQTWESQRTLPPQLFGDFVGITSLTTDGKDGVYLTFLNAHDPDPYSCDTYAKSSTDGGTTWGPSVQLTTTASAYAGSIAADTLGRVHLAWIDERSGREVFYSRSTNRGSQWGTPTQISTSSAKGGDVSLGCDGGDYLYLTWEDFRDGNWEIYYLRSTNGGSTWGGETRLTNSSSPSLYPNIAADPYGGVYIVCQDSADGAKGIWFLSSTDRGTNWNAATKLSGNVFGGFSCPNVAVDPVRRLHVAWSNDTLGSQPGSHPTIMYKRGSLFSGIEDQAVQPAEGLSVSKLQLKASSPVSRTLALRYLLPQPGPVAKLELYDALGRKVESLFEGQRAAGWHELCKPLSLPGGVYFVRLEAGRESAVRKVVVVR